MKPLILISNDDGYLAKGINSLIEMLRPLGDLVVVAPDRPRSAAGASITTTVPISASVVKKEEGVVVYSCTGTPADCLKLGLSQYVDRKPDLVVGGINHGTNATINEHYSGTVSIAKEGAMHGIPSMAVSLCDFDADANFEPLTPYVQQLAKVLIEKGLPFGSLLNVNFPLVDQFKGVKVCKMSMGCWEKEYTRTEEYYGKPYYWLGGVNVDYDPQDTMSDNWALNNGYVAITPLKIDETDYQLMEEVSKWDV